MKPILSHLKFETKRIVSCNLNNFSRCCLVVAIGHDEVMPMTVRTIYPCILCSALACTGTSEQRKHSAANAKPCRVVADSRRVLLLAAGKSQRNLTLLL